MALKVILMDKSSQERDYVQSLARGLDVIRAFTRNHSSMTLSEVSREAGVTRAAARRLLLTLVKEGYAETDGKYFTLRPRVLELGYSYLSSVPFSEVAQPIMSEVVNKTQESCSAGVLDGTEMVFVARVQIERIMTVGLSVGSRLPAYCGSMGRILLASLPKERLEEVLENTTIERRTPYTVRNMVELREAIDLARLQGWAIIDQEMEVGLRSIAVPIRSRNGETIAALNIAVHAGRVSLEEIKERLLPPLLDASFKISERLPA